MRYYFEDYVRTDDGADIWYAVLGEGEPVLITCDGLGCDGFAWKHLIRHLTPRYRMIRFNYRGHGRSSVAEDPTRLGVQYFADDLALVLRTIGVEQGVVLGHSMGVQVALEFHRRHPTRVSGLVPICGSYGNPLDTVHDDAKVKAFFPLLRKVTERFPGVARAVAGAVMPSEIAFQYALWLEVNRHLVHRKDFAPYFAHLARMDPVVFVRPLEAASHHTAWDHLPKVDVPTLVVAAEHDRFTPVWLSRRMHRAIPGSEMLIVPTGTHTAIIEMPELISLRIERFLKERVVSAQAA